MRLRKNPEWIMIGKESDRVEPFRTILLDEAELAAVESVMNQDASEESEKILQGILDCRGMGHLMYSDKKTEQWSGYVLLHGKELWLV